MPILQARQDWSENLALRPSQENDRLCDFTGVTWQEGKDKDDQIPVEE
jgi:hypothetical protein